MNEQENKNILEKTKKAVVDLFASLSDKISEWIDLIYEQGKKDGKE